MEAELLCCTAASCAATPVQCIIRLVGNWRSTLTVPHCGMCMLQVEGLKGRFSALEKQEVAHKKAKVNGCIDSTNTPALGSTKLLSKNCIAGVCQIRRNSHIATTSIVSWALWHLTRPV